MAGRNRRGGEPSVAGVNLLAVDLDGTLLDSNSRISTRNLDALSRAYAGGAEIAIVTGRRYSVARRLTASIHEPHYLVTNAGAWIASSDGEALESVSIEPMLLDGFIEHLQEFSGHAFRITSREGKGEILSSEPNLEDPHVARYIARNAHLMESPESLKADRPAPVLQVVCCGTIQRITGLRSRAAIFSRIQDLSLSQTVYPDRDFELADVVARGAGKGNALARLATLLALSPPRIMAIGDNFADCPMFELARYPVLMENAPAELRGQWPATASNDQDGVAQAIERVFTWK